MQKIGRWMQILGLVVLPVSILLELSGALDRSFGLSEMLLMMVFGFCAFYLGRYVESYAVK